MLYIAVVAPITMASEGTAAALKPRDASEGPDGIANVLHETGDEQRTPYRSQTADSGGEIGGSVWIGLERVVNRSDFHVLFLKGCCRKI
jgi:hypothetical protein